ncbi:MAG: RibD family protein, partial [Comamonas sp.]
VRGVATPRQPHLVIVDSGLRTPPGARLFDVPGRQVWIYAAREDAALAGALRARGATVSLLPGADGRVSLPALLRDLAARSVNELHLEAGPRLGGAFVQAGLVDEVLLYLAPMLLGSGGQRLADWGPLQALSQGLGLEWQGVERVGPDLRLLARAKGRADFSDLR